MSNHENTDEASLLKLVDDEISNNCKSYDQIDTKVAHKFALFGYRAGQESRNVTNRMLLSTNCSLSDKITALREKNDRLKEELEQALEDYQDIGRELAKERVQDKKYRELLEENLRFKEFILEDQAELLSLRKENEKLITRIKELDDRGTF